MLAIKVLGPGCMNCKKVEEMVRKAVNQLDVSADIQKITDYADIMAYDILSTPGLIINEKVVCSGRVPTEAEVISWLADDLTNVD